MYQPLQTVKLCCTKTILAFATLCVYFDISSSIFLVQDHIMGTAGKGKPASLTKGNLPAFAVDGGKDGRFRVLSV
jgi:hypothetical protein